MATMIKVVAFALMLSTAAVAQAQLQVTPPWRKAEPAPPVPLPPPPAAARVAPSEPSLPAEKQEPSWYLPQAQDSERPWNHSYWGPYSSWSEPSRAAGLAYRSHTFGLRSMSSATSDATRTFAKDTLSSSFLGARFEFGRAAAFELGKGSLRGTGIGGADSIDGLVLGMSSLTGSKILYDWGLPDVQIGLLFPEINLSVLYANPDADTSVFAGSMDLNAFGLRVTLLDLVKVDLMLFDIGYDFMMIDVKKSASTVADTVTGGGFRFDPLAVTFRAGVVF